MDEQHGQNNFEPVQRYWSARLVYVCVVWTERLLDPLQNQPDSQETLHWNVLNRALYIYVSDLYHFM